MKYYKSPLVISIVLVFVLLFSLPTISEAAGIYLSPTQTGLKALNSNPGAVNARNNLFSLGFLAQADLRNNLLINDYMDQSTKDNLLSQIDDFWIVTNKIQTGGHIALGPIAGFSRIRENSFFNVPYQTAETIFRGNSPEELNIKLDNLQGKGALLGDVGVNLSFQVPESRIYLGMNYHYLTGVIFEARGEGEFCYSLDEEGEPDYTGNGKVKVITNDPTQNLASGSVFDIGLYSQIKEGLGLGVSINNIGEITADKTQYVTVEISDFENSNDNLEWKNSSENLNWNVPISTNFGAKYEITNNTIISGNISYTSYNEDVKDLACGLNTSLEHISFLPVEIGVNYSSLLNDITVDTGLGLNLGIINTRVSFSDIKGLINRSKEGRIRIYSTIKF